MNAYRQQQLRAAALIESGATAEQIAAVFGWIKTRAAPEQIETGDKNALTRRRKCGIIKAIRRYVRRAKKARRAKTMKCYEFGFYADSGEFFEIRENGFEGGRKYYVTADSAEKAYSEFVGALNEEYCGDGMTVREIPTGHNMTDYIKL